MKTTSTTTKTRKPRSKFALLPAEDQKRVIELCDQHTYHEALDIIALPRPEGLQFQSSYGALVRFYSSYNQHARAAHLLGQSARTVQLSRQAHPGALRGAILTMVESRIFEALRNNVPISELSTEFALLQDFHKGFLSEEKWRTEKDSNANSDWSLHLSSSPNPQKDDFIPVDEHGHPTEPEPLTDSDLAALSELDPDSDDQALAKLDYTIAAHGRNAAHLTAAVYGFSYSFVEQRIAAYKQQLRQRGITAAQAAIEARAAALKNPALKNPAPPTPTNNRKADRREALRTFIDDHNQLADSARQILQNPSNNANNPDKSTFIHSQPSANPHDPLKST